MFDLHFRPPWPSCSSYNMAVALYQLLFDMSRHLFVQTQFWYTTIQNYPAKDFEKAATLKFHVSEKDNNKLTRSTRTPFLCETAQSGKHVKFLFLSEQKLDTNKMPPRFTKCSLQQFLRNHAVHSLLCRSQLFLLKGFSTIGKRQNMFRIENGMGPGGSTFCNLGKSNRHMFRIPRVWNRASHYSSSPRALPTRLIFFFLFDMSVGR